MKTKMNYSPEKKFTTRNYLCFFFAICILITVVSGCEDVENPCDLDPCLNGGTCIPEGETFICQCTDEYSGDICEIKICSQGYTGPDCNQCADGYQDNDMDGICRPGCPAEPGQVDENIVQTAFGPIQGEYDTRVDAIAFLGIRFAASTAGDGRWAPPKNPECWSSPPVNQRPQYCTYPGDSGGKPCVCLQNEFDSDGNLIGQVGSEDCLFLNVWAPTPLPEDLPVLVFIHGGGNQQGSSSRDQLGTWMNDGARLAAESNVVVVTVQYRLGPLGYLSHEDLGAEHGIGGNYGLLDQIQALTWVRDNIRGFGGDPDKVLVFGESGGAVNTCMMYVTPLAQGLFSSALMQSGACTAKSAEDALAQGTAFAESVGCTEDIGVCLRAAGGQTLLAEVRPPVDQGFVTSVWGPTVDGWVLPDDPMKMIASGEHNHVPFMVGSNSYETSYMIQPPELVTPRTLELLLQSDELVAYKDELLALYPSASDRDDLTFDEKQAIALDSFIRLTTDSQFTCTARRIARAAVAGQNDPVYRYVFTHVMPNITIGDKVILDLESYGAWHGEELFYIFRSVEDSNLKSYLRDSDRAVENILGQAWSSLAAGGIPMIDVLDPDVWPAYNSEVDPYIELQAAPAAGAGYRNAECDLWDEIQAGRN